MMRFSVPLALIFLSHYAAAQENHTRAASFDDHVADLAELMRVPGAAWAVVLDGSVESVGGYGMADKATGRPVEPTKSVFRIASVSKVFTAYAVARLVADGRLDLGADLCHTWPWLPARLGDARPISLRQLLTHTSGLDDRVIGMFCRHVADVRPLEEYLSGNLPRRTTPAGRSARYSNHGFALAGLAVEEATGLSFAEAMRTLLFDPLGMDSSSFAQPLPRRLRKALARAYHPDETESIPIDWRNTAPAGAMVTSARDISVFMQALVARTGPLDSTTREILTRQQFTAHSSIPGLALALHEQAIGDWRALVHAGGSSGYRSLFVIVPEARAGLFLAATGGDSGFGAAVLALFAKELVGSIPGTKSAVKPERLSPADARQYGGVYLSGRAARATVECFPGLFLFSAPVIFDTDGYLVRTEGERQVRYGRIGQDLFQAVDGPERMAFERNSRGHVAALQASSVFFGARFPASYERLPVWREPGVMNELLSWALAVPVIACLSWLGLRFAIGIWRRCSRSKSIDGNAMPSTSWLTFGVCAALSCVMAVFGFGFMARFNGLARSAPEQLAYGLPPELAHLLWLPYVIAFLAAAACACCVQSWRRQGLVTDRLLLTVTSCCAFILLALLIHFQMLPPSV